jgi:hypothetical protein
MAKTAKKNWPEPVQKVVDKAVEGLKKINLKKKVFGSKEPIVNEYTKMAAGAGAAIPVAAYGKEIAQAAKKVPKKVKQVVKNVKKGVKRVKSDVSYSTQKAKNKVLTAVRGVPSGKRKIK